MKMRISKDLFKIALAMLCACAPLSADPQDCDEEGHALVETRPLSDEEVMEIKEARAFEEKLNEENSEAIALEDQPLAQDSEEQNLATQEFKEQDLEQQESDEQDLEQQESDEQDLEEQESGKQNLVLQNIEEQDLEEQESDGSDEPVEEERMENGHSPIYFSSSHAAAYQHTKAISATGETVELHDGSIWTVASRDAHLVADWKNGQTIVIVQNRDWFDWFSKCDFKLVNQFTGDYARAKISLGPLLNNKHTHWVVDIQGSLVVLEDGTTWSIYSADAEILSSWLRDDVVIIGINDGWFRSFNPNLLINPATGTYVRGFCVTH
jgi:hypothetical protein